MFLSEVFEHLTYGELSQLFVGSEDDSINESDYPKVISFINMAMIDLYKKFPLLEKEVLIDLDEAITNYLLTSMYTVSSGTAPVKYIIDTVESPFENDILQISSVWDEDGESVPLNDLNKADSVFTPLFNSLQVPNSINETSLSVIYRAYPEKIDLTVNTLTTVETALPDQFMSPLLAYVGYRAHLGLPAGDKAKSTEFLSSYYGMCKEIRELGTVNKDNDTNLKLDTNGWS